ncbi:glycosyl hydrolase family 28-related protein [Lactiplantibacillus argentoratensis]|uniref:glycosyl hydrolase family 28-related protein n=1 Tax=Lactiplantibacillus argentoratensis TaxID=271881 RepID=UPI001B341530|nr:glycosyl hydrolase family 28-related protein [Lactiplantibacillus argentoratensis]MBP5807824.1 hypothetical protein [Lactiplantibacillus argentoratensis]
MISTITLDTYKQQISSGDAFNLSDSFNGRVGDEQVPLVVQFKERGLAHRFEDGLVPFLSGFVGSLDENDQVTAATGEAVSYVGTSDDIVGLGRVKMNLPGTIFPQEGYFYGFLGLQNADGKRVTTFNVWFHVYNGNPDMFVNKAPFRTELQKLLDTVKLLIDDSNGDLNTWKQKLTDLFTTLSAQGTDTTTLLTTLQVQIKQSNLFTQGQMDELLGSLTSFKPMGSNLIDKLNNEFNDRGVNVKWFGAVGDGVTDSTEAIQKAIDDAHKTAINSNLDINPTIIIPSGRYKITSTLKLSQFQHIYAAGPVTIESYANDLPAVWIAPLDGDPDFNDDYAAQQYNRMPLIGGQGLRIKWSGGWTRGKEIGLELGSRSNLGKNKTLARYRVENLAIDSFHTGVKMNGYNHYLGSFDHCQLEPNDIAVLIGDENKIADAVNSGERFDFIDCIFGEAKQGFLINTGNFEINLIGSSIDFIDKQFVFNRGYTKANVSQSHLENMRRIAVSSQEDQSQAMLNIDNSTINTVDDSYLFEGHFLLSTNGVKYERSSPMDGTRLYMCDDDVTARESDTYNQTNDTMLSPNLNLIYNPYFNVGELGLNGFTHSEMGIDDLGMITSGFPDGTDYVSVLSFKRNKDSDGHFTLRSEQVTVSAGQNLESGIIVYSEDLDWKGLSVLYRFFNEMGQQINDTDSPVVIKDQVNNNHWFSAFKHRIVPMHAVTATVEYAFFNMNNIAQYYIGEIGLNKR